MRRVPPGARALPVSLMLLALAVPALAQQTTAPSSAPTAQDEEAARRNAAIAANRDGTASAPGSSSGDVVTLSPFVVNTTRDSGYYAANTLAGSRMSTNIADLAASISVITKQQMEDTGSIDANDMFRYEVNTEGSGTYTPSGVGYLSMRSDGVADANAGATLGNSMTPFTNAQANRVRGLGVPSAAINYYPSIGAIPLDSYNIQSVEISRGPNSMLFGMGSPAGIVNQTTASALLGQNTHNVTLRTDHMGSMRGSVSFNRGITDNFALYGAAVYDDRRFEREPAYDKTKRQYLAATFKPFEKTTIRANFENYRNDNRRPNTLTPRDFVTEWNLAGRPIYDSQTRTVSRGNTVVGSYVAAAGSPFANEVRTFIRSQPNYNAALRGGQPAGQAVSDTNFTTYNGVAIFGNGVLGNAVNFSPRNNIASNNILFVPGITFHTTGNQSRPIMQIADGQLYNWYQPTALRTYPVGWSIPPAANPANSPNEAAILANSTWASVYNREVSLSSGWTAANNGIIGYRYAGVTDKSIYDWENVNILEMNFGQDRNKNYNVELEQKLADNLYLNAGWFRQDFEQVSNYTVAQLNVTTLFIDTNKYLPDGSANPFVGKPYVEDFDPDRYINRAKDDHYRVMLAYTPDFTGRNGWTRWLGRHQLLGMASRDEYLATSIRQRINTIAAGSDLARFRYLNNSNNNADGTPTGWSYQNTSQRRQFYLAAPGDANGVVTRSPGEWNPITYQGDVRVYDYNTSAFTNANLTTTFNTFDAGTERTFRQIDTLSAGLSSYLWNERLVTTLGIRKDKYKARRAHNGIIRDETGAQLEAPLTNPQKWVNGNYNTDLVFNRWDAWNREEGTTQTLGGVLRPFRKWTSIESRANNGSLFWQFVRDFGITYNQSDNFNAPTGVQTDVFGNKLPKPTGEGKDYGFQFSLFDNKLFARVSWFEASNEAERMSAGQALNRLNINMDQTLFRNWARTIVMINMGMDPRSETFGQNLTPAQNTAIEAAIEPIWGIPYNYYTGVSPTVTRDGQAKGMEAEINYNPSRNWTMKFTFGKQDAKYSNVLKEFDAWYDYRFPTWQAAQASKFLLPQYASLARYTTFGGREVDLTNFLTSYGYASEVRLDEPSGNTNVTNYYNINVNPQVLLARDLEGQSAPGQRKYRFSYLTKYDFTEGALRGWFVGGAVRWESKSVIGYYGRASGANGTQLDVSDVSRPIYDSANTYADIWFGYQRRLWDEKVRMKLQLNVVNVTESGGLQPVGVNFDGSPYAFRIVDPRQFILSASFDF